ncbi:MAG: PH domain-containing protein [Muribaculaceae bacterium]|nr:PH domain-containing protein [Muribaculaceae bacterium]
MDKTILKKRVKLSGWSTAMTIFTMVFLIGICIWQFHETENEFYCWLLLGIVAVWSFSTLFYSPMYIILNEDSINVETLMHVRRFPLDEIVSVKICEPTMSEHRICGSGGYFGYWGWFREPSIGKYFAYYGKASQTFLIRLKSGRQYMLGCRDSKEMAKALADQLNLIRNNQ